MNLEPKIMNNEEKMMNEATKKRQNNKENDVQEQIQIENMTCFGYYLNFIWLYIKIGFTIISFSISYIIVTYIKMCLQGLYLALQLAHPI